MFAVSSSMKYGLVPAAVAEAFEGLGVGMCLQPGR